MTERDGSATLAGTSEGFLARTALGFTRWAERWFPDAYIFAALAVGLVGVAALANGAADNGHMVLYPGTDGFTRDFAGGGNLRR